MNEQTAISGSLALNSAPHVIMIPASGPVRTRKLRVAAYARVSSNSEDQITPLPRRMPTTQNSSPATRNGSLWTYMRMIQLYLD